VAIRLRTIDRSKGTLHFRARLDDRALKDFMVLVDEAQSRHFNPIVLDFRRLSEAYSDSVLPLIAIVEERLARGQGFRVLPPEDETIARLFRNAGWSALLEGSEPHTLSGHKHLPVRRYRDHSEQQAVVRDAVDCVLRNMSLHRSAIRALEWTVNEITDNVLNHARADRGGLVQVNTFTAQQKIKLVVCDAGRGIPAAMRESFPHLRDGEAITEAMKPGVTSPRDAGQGNGLAGSTRIAQYAHGSFKILSGGAGLSLFRDDRGQYKVQKSAPPRTHKFPCTTVMVELSTAVDFDIEEALALDGRRTELLDVVDLRYAADDGSLVVKICDETLGVGTRHAGAELRLKCSNLLAAEPGKRLVLDWTGIPLVSSSFADEAIGKLFVELGFMLFTSRVSHTGAEPLVASLLNRAVMQRVAQEAAK
jgi:anti-sigma regulatory factor (Ser/Thr protein kinase)